MATSSQRKILGSKEEPLTLVVLGAGVDATMGLPTSADLIPRIVDYLATDEGIKLDAILRKVIGRVHFHFDKFVSTAVDRLAKDLDKEIVSICHNINDELDNNKSLDETQRKLGMLIVRLFKKVLDFKKGAEIDTETMNLIEEVFDTVVKDDSIIDLSHLNYTDTFKNIIVEILQKSIHESNNPFISATDEDASCHIQALYRHMVSCFPDGATCQHNNLSWLFIFICRQLFL